MDKDGYLKMDESVFSLKFYIELPFDLCETTLKSTLTY